MTRAFDPDGAIEFDLPRGAVRGVDDRLLLVPSTILEEIAVTAGSEAAVTVARAIGASCGQRVAVRMGGVGAARAGSIEDVTTQLAGELALSGLGIAHVERWGRAVVLVLGNTPVRDDGAVAALVEGALAALVDRPVATLVLARDGDGVRVLVASATAVLRVKGLMDGGASFGDALGKLQSRGEA
jgi:hypothetical protein